MNWHDNVARLRDTRRADRRDRRAASDAVRRYIEETGLPFDILIDESRDVLKAYGVWHASGSTPGTSRGRRVFLIDRSGAIRYSFVAETAGRVPVARAKSWRRSTDC